MTDNKELEINKERSRGYWIEFLFWDLKVKPKRNYISKVPKKTQEEIRIECVLAL